MNRRQKGLFSKVVRGTSTGIGFTSALIVPEPSGFEFPVVPTSLSSRRYGSH